MHLCLAAPHLRLSGHKTIQYAPLQDVRALHRCARLQTLKLEGNKLSRLEGLEGDLLSQCSAVP